MEQFLHDNAIFVVLGIVLILWLGISVYLFMIDKKITSLEKELENKLESTAHNHN